MGNLVGVIKKYYQQFLFVLAAFFSLVVIGFYYVSNIMEKNLAEQGEKTLISAESEINAVLGQAETALGDAAFQALVLMEQDASKGDMSVFYHQWGIWLAENLSYYKDFRGVYGIIDGNFVSSIGFIPQAGVSFETESWYTNAGGKRAFFSEPHKDIKTGETVITVSKSVIDSEGNNRGVLAIDIDADFISDIAARMQISGSGYGVVLDEVGIVVAHKNREFIGKEFPAAMAGISQRGSVNPVQNIVDGIPVSGARFNDYDHTRSIMFFSKILNNWSIGVIFPVSEFYGGVYDMTFVMAMMGFILVLIVGYFMTLLTFEKMRSDEENQNKSSFLAKMSHELRTPLNAVLGMSELILREDIPHNIYENALSIKQASTNLISIINDILDYSKIEAGKLEIVPINYYFSSLINDVVNIIRMRLTEKPIRLTVNIDCMVPNNLYGDEIRIRQVLINLLSNAVKYTKEGSISVDIYGEIKEADIYDFTIDITDTGIGIKDEDINKLFGDFVQINMLSNKGVEGTGLGLVIARNICRAMGGDITVKSVYGEGSTFTAKISQAFSNYENFACVEDSVNKRVLVYETRVVYAVSVTKTLKNLGVAYAAVQNQNQFYEELKKYAYPFIFVSSFLFSSAKNILDKLDLKTKLVLISEYGEAITAKCDRIIEMPAYCVAVANILNDIIEDTSSRESAETGIRFVAPEAKVLIVDDIATNLKVAEGLMAPYNMQVDTAKSGMEAIERVTKNRYDIVFMDHMMPGMDGIEATGRIRDMKDGTDYYQNLPIIALTAMAISGVKEMFLQNGLNDFLAKPIEMAKLNIILDKWIPKEKQEREKTVSEAVIGETINIDGIDTKVGLSMTGGTVDMYMRVLDIFYKDCLEKMDEIALALQNNDIYLYTTYVHALKSASANVGAGKVSEYAKNLESAGKNEDVMYITENNDKFFAEIRALLENIKPVLNKADEDNAAETGEEDIEKLKDNLTKLKTALDEMDIGAVDTIVSELQAVKWSGDTKDMVEGIFHSILMFEYDEATAQINEILSK